MAGIAFLVTLIAVWRTEATTPAAAADPAAPRPKAPFRQVVAEMWADPLARRFTIFVFISMLAYSAQELILEPFAGLVFKMTPGQSRSFRAFSTGASCSA